MGRKIERMDFLTQEPLEVLKEFEDEAEVLLCAIGPLNRWKMPDLGVGRLQGSGCPYCGLARGLWAGAVQGGGAR